MAQRLKFWGWGYENERLSAAEEGRLAAFYGERLGAGDAERLPVPEVDDIALAPPRLAPPAALAAMCSSDPYERLLHTYGKSFPDTVRIFDKDFANAPDVVAYPRDDGGVAAILDWATSANAAVIPFGGGSSVVGGVEPAVGDGYAGTISLDVKRLDRVLEIDPHEPGRAHPGRHHGAGPRSGAPSPRFDPAPLPTELPVLDAGRLDRDALGRAFRDALHAHR